MEKDREDRMCKVRQVQGWVKGTEKERDIEDVKEVMKESSEYWGSDMSGRIEFVKGARTPTSAEVERMIEDCNRIVRKHKEQLEEDIMKIGKIIGFSTSCLDKKLKEEEAREKLEEENKQEDIEQEDIESG